MTLSELIKTRKKLKCLYREIQKELDKMNGDDLKLYQNLPELIMTIKVQDERTNTINITSVEDLIIELERIGINDRTIDILLGIEFKMNLVYKFDFPNTPTQKPFKMILAYVNQ